MKDAMAYVKSKYPEACIRSIGAKRKLYSIVADGWTLGNGTSEESAWEDAAEQIHLAEEVNP